MSKKAEWEENRKKALIAICTLGISAAPWKIVFSSFGDGDKGMSFEGTAIGFVFRILWFLLWTILTLGVVWIINIFKFINYSISLSRLNRN